MAKTSSVFDALYVASGKSEYTQSKTFPTPSSGLELHLWRKVQLKFLFVRTPQSCHKPWTKKQNGSTATFRVSYSRYPNWKGYKKTCAEDKNASQILFNSAYYLAKQERPFSGSPDLIKLQEKNKTPGINECYRNDRVAANFTDSIAKVTKDSFAKKLAKARYFCILTDGSTDIALLRKKPVYVLFHLCGKPTLKFLSIEPANNANAEGIHSCIKQA